MHSDHAGRQRVAAAEAAAAHDRDGDGGVDAVRQRLKFVMRPRTDDAAAADEQGLLRRGNHLDQLVDVAVVGFGRLEILA